MRRHQGIESSAQTQVQTVAEPGTQRAILPIAVRTAFGGAAAALLLVAARLPIWQAQFSAPQYPKGLNIAAYGGKVEGDLSEINELSHYIGMPPFNFVGMPEMRLWPLVIALAIVAVVLAVAPRWAWLRRLACAALWLIPVGALADVQFRLYQVGHSLDPTSAIRVSPFTPHVLGPTTMMNFTVIGLPGTALVLIAVAAALVTSAPFVVARLMRGRGPASDTSQTDAEPADTELPDAKLTGGRLTDTELTDTELTDTELTDTELTDTELTDTELTDTELTDTELTDTGLTDTGLTDTGLTDTGLTDTGLKLP
jgi:copper chaperone NosL